MDTSKLFQASTNMEGREETRRLLKLGKAEATEILKNSRKSKLELKQWIEAECQRAIERTPSQRTRGSWMGHVDEKKATLSAWQMDPYIKGFMGVLE